MNISNKIILILISFLFFHFSASAGKVEKGYEALKIYNYFEAKRLFTESLKKDSSTSAYGLALIYFRNDNPFHSLDSAYRYNCISERNFNKVSDKNKIIFRKYGFEYLNIVDLRSKISLEYYQIAVKENSIRGFEDFIKKNDWSNERFQAIYKRDSLAFEFASKENSSKSFKQFLDLYPSSDFVRAVQKELELCQFRETTKSGTISSYLLFCKQYPRNRHVKDAEDKIYELSVKGNENNDYISFISNFPLNRNVESAWRKVYQLFMIDYSEDRILQFQKKYPDYPFKSELEQDMKFSQRKLVPQKEEDQFGFMDYEGNKIIDPIYEYAGFYNDGLAVVAKNGKYGYIDKGNNIVIDFIYSSATDFEDGRAIVELNNKLGIIDRAGNIILPIDFEELGTFSEGLIYGKRDSLYGYYDNTGYQRLEEKYTEAFSFSNGIAEIQIGKFQTFIDVYGGVIVSPIFESINFFNDSLLVFELEGKFGICRKNGQIVDSSKYDFIGVLANDRALVSKNGLIGYLNGSGKIVLDLKFEEFPNYIENGQFNGNYSVVRHKRKFGVIDKLGKMVIPAIYLQMGNYSSLIACSKGKGWGFVDITNTPVILPQYDFAESFKDGYAVVEKLGLSGLINQKGEVTVPILFNEISSIDEERVIVSIGANFGLYKMNGEIIVPAEYEQIRILDKDFLILTKSGEVHYLYLPQNKLIKPKTGDE